MGDLSKVPCVQIDQSNIANCWKHLTDCISKAHFVAIDLELSGLGDKSQLNESNIEERYKNISKVAQSRSILSVGLSFFRLKNNPKLNLEWLFEVDNFNILTSCLDEFELEDESKNFLSSYGFDFDHQKTYGLPYSRGNQSISPDDHSIRRIIMLLLAKKLPFIFHNGLIDMIYMYECFIASLPPRLDIFVANTFHLMPAGVFDTKLMAATYLSEKIKNSYLAYLFYERQRNNLVRKHRSLSYLSLEFPKLSNLNTYEFCSLRTKILQDIPKGVTLCKDYKTYGWCKKLNQCPKSHNVDLILDQSDKMKSCAKKILLQIKRLETSATNDERKNGKDCTDPNSNHQNSKDGGIHNAGYDAFMTGYCFMTLLVEILAHKKGYSGQALGIAKELKGYKNCIFLTSSPSPLRFRKSEFVRPSITLASFLST